MKQEYLKHKWIEMQIMSTDRQDTRPRYISALNIGPRNINFTYSDMIKCVLSYTSTFARKQEWK